MTKPLFSASIYLALILFFLIVAVIVQFVGGYDPETFNVIDNCLQKHIYHVAIQALIAVIMIIFFIVKLRHVKDAFFIKTEMIGTACGAIPLFIAWAVSSMLSFSTGQHLFLVLGLVYVCLWTLYFPVIMSFYQDKKKLFRVDTSLLPLHIKEAIGSSDMEKQEAILFYCLTNEVLSEAFMQYCVESWSVENFLFWKDVEHFKLVITDEDRASIVASNIINRYLLPTSTLLLNLPDVVVKKTLATAKTGLSSSTFETCQAHVFRTMFEDTYLKWKGTKEFKEAIETARGTSSRQSRSSRNHLSPKISPNASHEFQMNVVV